MYDEEHKPRGEYVLIIDGYDDSMDSEYSFEDAVKLARQYVKEGNSASAAAKMAAADTGLKKGEIYKQLLV